MIAKLASSRELFAFEKVDLDTYVCFPLNHWIRTQWIEQAAVGAAPVVTLSILLQAQQDVSHHRNLSISSVNGPVSNLSNPSSPKVPQNRRGQFARRSILDLRETSEKPQAASNTLGQAPAGQGAVNDRQIGNESNTQSFDTAVAIDTHPLFEARPSAPLAESANTGALEKFCAPAEPLPVVDQLSVDYLRRQYLETLYLSRTSLAFYAKGPLSRARARVRVPTASRTVEQLVEFYRDCILPRKKVDLKYKETIPHRISSLTSYEAIEASTAEVSYGPKKTRRTKLGKDALWPCESDYIARWWRERELIPNLTTDTKRADEVSKAITQLRMRETELQIILILEILALEARDIAKLQPARPLPDQDVKVESVEHDEGTAVAIVTPIKKKRDLKPEVDFLVDRMCIWHSIGLEDGESASSETRSELTSGRLKDRLRDFCKDVIVPFYGGKLPDQCQTICSKMGGPEVSPRRPQNLPEKQPNQTKSGAVVPPEKALNKRPLKRVNSEDQNARHFSPPLLPRSSTLPMSMALKRETSERPASRSSLQKSVSFSNREVDLESDARVTAAKRRKLDLVAAQKRELNAAIEALKRPNRSVVAKNFMDDVEERATKGTTIAKRLEPIQISATPKRNRAKYMQTDDLDLPSLPSMTVTQEQTLIPSSAIRPRGLYHISEISRSSAKKRAVLSAIHDTPSKSAVCAADGHRLPCRQHPDSENEAKDAFSSTVVISTPTTSRIRSEPVSSVSATPMRMNKSQKHVILTPMKRSEISVEKAFKDIPEIPERAGRTMDRVMGSKLNAAELSIYDSLGWNDDDDDL